MLNERFGRPLTQKDIKGEYESKTYWVVPLGNSESRSKLLADQIAEVHIIAANPKLFKFNRMDSQFVESGRYDGSYDANNYGHILFDTKESALFFIKRVQIIDKLKAAMMVVQPELLYKINKLIVDEYDECVDSLIFADIDFNQFFNKEIK